jgi:TetR/AcrR family transcriptional repressor of lmrAB and yxaGH operons
MLSAREQIIHTTCDLLELQGYHATGLNQIIKESGSPKGSLYHYFPGGKEELAIEAVRHVGQQVLRRIQDNLALLEDPTEAVRQFIIAIAFNVERSGYRAGGPITTIALEMASTSERLRETCHDIYGQWQAAFAHKLSQAGLDAERAQRLALLIIAAIEGGVILSRTQHSPAPLQQVAEEVACLLRSAL